jgi:hypothetical protein
MGGELSPVLIQEHTNALEFELIQPPVREKLRLMPRAFSLIGYAVAGFAWLAAALAATVVAWFAIIITGQYPSGLFDFNARAWRFLVTSNCYGLLLVDARPSYSGAPDLAYPVQANVTRLPQYNRLLTAFRFPLLIPLYIVYVLVMLAAFAAALPSIATLKLFRRQPASLYRVVAFAMRVYANITSSMFLLTEILWLSN